MFTIGHDATNDFTRCLPYRGRLIIHEYMMPLTSTMQTHVTNTKIPGLDLPRENWKFVFPLVLKYHGSISKYE